MPWRELIKINFKVKMMNGKNISTEYYLSRNRFFVEWILHRRFHFYLSEDYPIETHV